MADTVCTSLPSILWRIQSYSTSGKKVHTLSFLGSSWKLIFSRVSENGTPKIILRMECCSNVPENLQTLKLNSDTCILKNNAYQYLPMKSEITLKDEEWCVWSYPISNIIQQIGQVLDICFSVKIYPYDIKKEHIMLVEKIRLQSEEEKVSCKAYLCQDIAHLYENSEQSDFELRCKELRMPVHKAVLSARSGYFAALFRSPMKEADKGYVEFHDIEPQILQHVVKYLYSGTLPESALECLPEVYAVADRFDFKSLRVKCLFLLMNSFSEGHQTSTENASQEIKVLPVSLDEKREKLLEMLFKSSEWKTLFEECPDLADIMFKPLILQFPKQK